MTTASDIIQEALESIGAYGSGETMTSADASRGLTILNNMLDEWSNNSLTTYAINEQSVTFTPGDFQYTIGPDPSADVVGPRPLRIIATPGSAYVLDFNGNQYGMDVITQAEWNMRGSRNTDSNFPDVLFYDPQFPLGILNFDPMPNIGYTAYFDSYIQFSEFGGLTGTLSLPPGYEIAIKRNVALEFLPFWGTGGLDQRAMDRLERSAARTLASVKRTNIRLKTSNFDPEILSKAPGIYNIYNDSYRR